LLSSSDPLILAQVSDYLGRHGACVLAAPYREISIDELRQRHPDLVILEASWPRSDNARRLVADTIAENIPLLIVSPPVGAEAMIQWFQPGAVDYIIQPFECEDMLGRISALLKSREFARDLREQNAALRAANEALKAQAEERAHALAQAQALLQEQADERRRAEEALAAERSILRVLVDHLPDRIVVKDVDGQFVLVNGATLQHIESTELNRVVGTIDLDAQPSEVVGHAQTDEQGVVQSGRPVVAQEEALVDQETGARRWVLTTRVPVRNSQGEIIRLVSMSRDITRRKRAEQHLALRLAVTRIVSESESRQAAVPKLLEAICAGMGWDLGELWRVDSNANLLRWEGAWHMPALQAATFVDASRAMSFPPGADLPGQVWAAGRPLGLADVAVAADAPRQSLASSLGLKHCVAFPIRGSNTVLGVLLFWSREALSHDADLLTTITDLGSQIGLFFDRMRAEERLRHYVARVVDAQEAERDHIARELHDEIGQALALIKMNVRAVQRHARESELAPRLEQSLAMIEEALQRVRAMALDLRPSMLDDLGLVTTLRWYVERHAQWAGLNAEVVAENFDARIPQHLETVCFRVAQEALSNVARHAQARIVRIRLWQRDAAVHMLLRDDGVGFDVLGAHERAVDGASIGLLAMEDRVMLAGGQLVIESAPGRGTTVWLRLPLMENTSAGEPSM
jgi:PAS domain S-box-containing protein